MKIRHLKHVPSSATSVQIQRVRTLLILTFVTSVVIVSVETVWSTKHSCGTHKAMVVPAVYFQVRKEAFVVSVSSLVLNTVENIIFGAIRQTFVEASPYQSLDSLHQQVLRLVLLWVSRRVQMNLPDCQSGYVLNVSCDAKEGDIAIFR